MKVLRWQKHENVPSLLGLHDPRLRHGLEPQGSTIWLQYWPVKPIGQLHPYVKVVIVKQVAPFWHKLIWQGLIKVWQTEPVYPATQLHMYDKPVDWQVAPFKQGLLKHALS